jgi:hypothetical protein
MSSESPYAPPKSSLINTNSGGMRRKGRYVIFDPDIEWPSRCFKCNKATSHKKRVKLAYVNPWIYLSVLINVIITVVLAAVFQKRFSVDLPLCEEHTIKRRNFLILQWVMAALLAASIGVAISTESLAFSVTAIFVFIVLVISAIFGRLAFAAKLKNGNLWVTGAGKDFLNSLPEFVD